MRPILNLKQALEQTGKAIYLGRRGASPIFGTREDHLLTIGPPRSGKTTRLLVPSVAAHPGPVIAVSTRPDLMTDTLTARRAIAEEEGGDVHQLSLAGSYTKTDIPVVRWDLTEGCQNWEVARDRATTLVATAIPPSAGGDTVWRDSASVALSGCLYGAALLGHSDAEMASYIRTGNIYHYKNAILSLDPNRRHPAAQSFSWLDDDRVIADNTRRSVFFVLSQQALQGFDYQTTAAPKALVESLAASEGSTTYITIPFERRSQAAPLVTSFIEAMVAAWRKRWWNAVSEKKSTLLICLDEAANISPLPSLPSLLSSGAGDGIQVIFALQEPTQASAWGADAGAVLDGSRLISIFPGIRDSDYLQRLVSLSHKQVMKDVDITVSSAWVGGDRYATAERLARERSIIEKALQGKPSSSRRSMMRRLSIDLARLRRRDGIRTLEDDSNMAQLVLEEIMKNTEVSLISDRRGRIEVADLAQQVEGSISLFSGGEYMRLSACHWASDPFWRSFLSPDGLT